MAQVPLLETAGEGAADMEVSTAEQAEISPEFVFKLADADNSKSIDVYEFAQVNSNTSKELL